MAMLLEVLTHSMPIQLDYTSPHRPTRRPHSSITQQAHSRNAQQAHSCTTDGPPGGGSTATSATTVARV